MPLDKETMQTALENRLKDNFERGKEEEWSADRAAEELAGAIADAIAAFVLSGDVRGVVTEVRNTAAVVIGTGSQTNTVKIT